MQKYGTNAAVVVKFVNALRRLIDTGFEKDGAEYKRDFKLLFFAYHLTNRPPTVYDKKTNTYKPVDSSVKCTPGVGVYFAETVTYFYGHFSKRRNLIHYSIKPNIPIDIGLVANHLNNLTPATLKLKEMIFDYVLCVIDRNGTGR